MNLNIVDRTCTTVHMSHMHQTSDSTMTCAAHLYTLLIANVCVLVEEFPNRLTQQTTQMFSLSPKAIRSPEVSTTYKSHSVVVSGVAFTRHHFDRRAAAIRTDTCRRCVPSMSRQDDSVEGCRLEVGRSTVIESLLCSGKNI